MENIMVNFKNNVIYIAKQKGIEPVELEKMFRLELPFFSSTMNLKDFPLFKAYRIAKYLEWDLMDLLEGQVWKDYRIKELEAELQMLKGDYIGTPVVNPIPERLMDAELTEQRRKLKGGVDYGKEYYNPGL